MKELSWQDFSTYLFVDRKLSGRKHNFHTHRSRFFIIYKWFKNKTWTRDNFTKFLKEKQGEGQMPRTLNSYICLAKHVDAFLKKNVLSGYTYFAEEDNVYDPLTPQEIKEMANVEINYYRDRDSHNARARALIMFLATTGARIGEVVAMKWTDLREEPPSVVIHTEKTNHVRIVPLSQTVYDMLLSEPRQSEYIFSTGKSRGAKMDTSLINKDLKIRAALCGVKKRVYCHIFRHSYITEMIKQRVPIAYISRIVGHEDLQSTNHYTNLVIEDLREAIYEHPLLKEALSFDLIIKKIKFAVERWVDTERFNLSLIQNKNKAIITIYK